MFIKFLCNSYHCVIFESLSHVINQESCLFVKFWGNLPRSFFEIFKTHSSLSQVNSVNLSQISPLNM